MQTKGEQLIDDAIEGIKKFLGDEYFAEISDNCTFPNPIEPFNVVDSCASNEHSGYHVDEQAIRNIRLNLNNLPWNRVELSADQEDLTINKKFVNIDYGTKEITMSMVVKVEQFTDDVDFYLSLIHPYDAPVRGVFQMEELEKRKIDFERSFFIDAGQRNYKLGSYKLEDWGKTTGDPQLFVKVKVNFEGRFCGLQQSRPKLKTIYEPLDNMLYQAAGKRIGSRELDELYTIWASLPSSIQKNPENQLLELEKQTRDAANVWLSRQDKIGIQLGQIPLLEDFKRQVGLNEIQMLPKRMLAVSQLQNEPNVFLQFSEQHLVGYKGQREIPSTTRRLIVKAKSKYPSAEDGLELYNPQLLLENENRNVKIIFQIPKSIHLKEASEIWLEFDLTDYVLLIASGYWKVSFTYETKGSKKVDLYNDTDIDPYLKPFYLFLRQYANDNDLVQLVNKPEQQIDFYQKLKQFFEGPGSIAFCLNHWHKLGKYDKIRECLNVGNLNLIFDAPDGDVLQLFKNIVKEHLEHLHQKTTLIILMLKRLAKCTSENALPVVQEMISKGNVPPHYIYEFCPWVASDVPMFQCIGGCEQGLKGALSDRSPAWLFYKGYKVDFKEYYIEERLYLLQGDNERSVEAMAKSDSLPNSYFKKYLEIRHLRYIQIRHTSYYQFVRDRYLDLEEQFP
jgi:hypothetical protein